MIYKENDSRKVWDVKMSNLQISNKNEAKYISTIAFWTKVTSYKLKKELN